MNVSRLRVAFFLSVILPFVLALRAGRGQPSEHFGSSIASNSTVVLAPFTAGAGRTETSR